MSLPLNTPTAPGFYWARSDSCQWYNLIVQVHGDAPYMRLDAWDRLGETVHRDFPLWKVKGWGPLIWAGESGPSVPEDELKTIRS